jgi:hypothetical protein
LVMINLQISAQSIQNSPQNNLQYEREALHQNFRYGSTQVCNKDKHSNANF